MRWSHKPALPCHHIALSLFPEHGNQHNFELYDETIFDPSTFNSIGGAGDKLSPLGQQFKTHLIEINLLNIEDQNLQQELLSLPTSFAMEICQVKN